MNRTFKFLSLILLIIGFTSCVSDNLKPCETEYNEETVAYLCFSISPGGENSLTRAPQNEDWDSEDHLSEEGLPIESYINTDDMKVYLFSNMPSDEKGLLIGEMSLLQTVENSPFLFTGKINLDNEILIDSELSISFNLLVLANWNSVGASYPVMEDFVTSLRYIQDKSNYGFELKDKVLTPTMKGIGIPMFGLQMYRNIPLVDLKKTSAETPLMLSPISLDDQVEYRKNIPMLRSLLKMEIADNIMKDDQGYPKVTGVTIKNINDKGLFIPFSEAFKKGFSQVNSPSLPEEYENNSEFIFTSVDKYSTVNEEAYNNWVNRFENWFTVYLAETKYTTSGSDLNESTDTYLEITVSESENGSPSIKKVKLPSFPTSDNCLLRNHVYRIEVNMNKTIGSDLILKYVVCPWIEQEASEIKFD